MKKTHKYGIKEFQTLRKMLLIMRLVLVISLICAIQSFALNSYSQSSGISLSASDMKLVDILEQIENESKYRFAYNKNEIDVEKGYAVDFQNEEIVDALQQLFSNGDIRYSIIGRQIVLTPSFTSGFSQQGIDVSGQVDDSSGAPLPGVTVVIKGTSKGTITDVDGNFSLANVRPNATLVFSFIGMKTQEIEVAGQASIHVQLEQDAIGLEEVVAVGYGTMRKSDLTGAVTRIDNTKNEVLPNTNVIHALNGVIPGISISAGGNAGSGSEILVRGQNSISGGNSALVVVDGIIYNGQIGNLNPNDIESIDVLRDASSSAIFGARAANGVILITTKKGSTEKPTINVNSQVGIQDILMTRDLETTEQYIQKRFDYQRTLAYRGVSPEPDLDNPVTFLNDAEIDNYLNGITVDAYDRISRIAPIQNYNLSIGAKKNNTNYYVSGSWTDQKGVVLGDQFKRASVRINLESEITNWLTIGTNSSFSYVDTSGAKADLQNAFQLSPFATWYLDEEETILNPVPMTDALIQSPLMPTLNQVEKNRKNLFCIAYAELELPFLKGLAYRFSYANELGFSKNYTFVPSFPYGGWNRVAAASNNLSESQDMTIENLLKYNRTFAVDHAVDVTLLYNYNSVYDNSLTAKSNTFPTDILDWYSLSLGTNQTTFAGYSDYHAIGMMARLNYRYKSKYLFTVTGRRDGASVFSSNNKFAFFPSVAVGWVMSEENFLKDNNLVDFLKVRLSYGANGNQAIDRYQSLSTIETGYNYLFSGNTAYGIAKSSMGNPDLKWESTYATNLGVDFELLDHRVSGNINLYDSDTKDLLLERNIPTLNGFSSILSNLGEVNNKGIEVMLNTVNIQSADFEWTTGFNFALNKNKIVKLYGETDEDGNELDDISNGWFIGKSLGAYYSYETDGIWQIGDDIPEGFRPGDFIIKDLNDDGQITPEYDRKILGFNRPDWTFGFSSSLRYKGFTLYALIKGSVGGVRDNASLFDPSSAFNYRMHDQYIEWWTPDNPSTSVPSMDYQDAYNIRWLQSTSFVRVQDISLSYDFSSRVIQKLRMGNLQLYVSSKNPFLFTDWGGWDPETTGSGKGKYPTMKSFVAGIKFSL